jgi:type I restriction enzyme, R subunit
MKPVVADPKTSFSQLMAEMSIVTDEPGLGLLRDQFLAKFQAKKRRLAGGNASDFETLTGMKPDVFARKLREMPLTQVADWFTENPHLGEILDRVNPSGQPLLISEHPDEIREVTRGYGRTQKPQDYLQEFKEYLHSNRDNIPALLTVLTRPRELTRKELRELALALDLAGFSETNITSAWRESTNQEIAAHIVGFIRHLATGDPLVPYEQRVDWALGQMLAARPWTTPQRDWLRRIAAQTKANTVVDREALDDPDLIFRREGGGFKRLDRLFDGRLAETLDEFHDLLWKPQNH